MDRSSLSLSVCAEQKGTNYFVTDFCSLNQVNDYDNDNIKPKQMTMRMIQVGFKLNSIQSNPMEDLIHDLC